MDSDSVCGDCICGIEAKTQRTYVKILYCLYLVCKAPHCWTANENTLGPHGQRFQYITSCPNSSVHIDLDPALNRVHDLWQCVNLLATEVKL